MGMLDHSPVTHFPMSAQISWSTILKLRRFLRFSKRKLVKTTTLHAAKEIALTTLPTITTLSFSASVKPIIRYLPHPA